MVTQNKIRIMVVDDHEIFIESLCVLLGGVPNIEVVATAKNGAEAKETIEQLLVKRELDLVLMDMEMAKVNNGNIPDGLKCTQEVLRMSRELRVPLKVIILTSANRGILVHKMRTAGVSGYLIKNCGRAELLKAIDYAMQGMRYFQHEALFTEEELITSNPGFEFSTIQIDTTEEKILTYLALGYSVDETADRVALSVGSVERYRRELKRKFMARNAPHLVLLAIKYGFINPYNLSDFD